MYRMSALPAAVSYGQGSPSLPAGASSHDTVIRSSNGQSFSENQTIVFDLNNTGFIDPASIYLRYKYAFTNTAGAQMMGTPAYTPFARLNLFSGSTQLESISQYSQVAHMLVQLTHDVSQKYGLQAAYGYKDSSSTPTLEELDSRTLTLNEVGSFSCPLPCALSNCEKYIPAFAIPQLRIELQVDTLANMFRSDGVGAPTVMTLSNVELCYKEINMGAEVEAMVRSAGLTHIKTQSFMNTASVLGAGAQGQVALVYNTRLSSIKSAFAFFASGQTDSNKEFDSCDITKANGSFYWTIAGKSYPQTPLSTAINKNGILMALKQATGSVYSKDNNFSINAVEWNKLDGDATTGSVMAKFILGVDTSVIDNDYIMSGVSSANSSITLNIQLGTATTDAHNVHAILNYDALLELDFAQGMASLKM